MLRLWGLGMRLRLAMRPSPVSEKQLRALSHQQLLEYVLCKHDNGTTEQPSATPNAEIQHSTDHPPRKKRRKEFDMSRYGQRQIALRLSYCGWLYHGFASQTDSDNTVEHHLFEALLRTHLITSRDTAKYSRSGRTDVGVSAYGQVVSLCLRSNVAPPSSASLEMDYVKIINAGLPHGIRVLAWSPVSENGKVPTVYDGDPTVIRAYWNAVANGKVPKEDLRRPGEPFCARFDATSRSYKYFFLRSNMDLGAMQKAAGHFVGRHDFRNFCRIDENVTNFERLMYQVEIRRASDDTVVGEAHLADHEYQHFYIFVKGQAFLWHQIRCMAAVLFDIGLRREHPSLIKRMLDDARSRTGPFGAGKPHYRMASPTPLLLYECAYPKEVLHFPMTSTSKEGSADKSSATSFERADAQLALGYAAEAARASILRCMLQENDRLMSEDDIWNDDLENGEGSELKAVHFSRSYLLDTNKGKHIPYEKRQRDSSVEEKQTRAVQRRRRRQVET